MTATATATLAAAAAATAEQLQLMGAAHTRAAQLRSLTHTRTHCKKNGAQYTKKQKK